MNNRRIKIYSPQRYPHWAAILILLLLAPLRIGAAELTGRITVEANGGAIFPGATSEVLPGNAQPVPLKRVKVYLGLLEGVSCRPGPPEECEAIYIHLSDDGGDPWSTQTDDNGEFRIFLYDDPLPWDPSYEINYVLVVVLESADSAVAVYDNNMDTDYVACMSTPGIPVSTRGSTWADIQLAVHPDNDSHYRVKGMEFRPVEDRQSTFAGITRCMEADLASPLIEGLPLPYDPKGLTNSKPGRFAHLAVHYARAYDVYEFVRDGLGKQGFTPVRVNAWDAYKKGAAYSCSASSTLR